MRKKLAILLLTMLCILCGCGDPGNDIPEPTPHSSSLTSGEKDGFRWHLRGSTLVISGQGKLDDRFTEDWRALSHEINAVELDPAITSIGDHVFTYRFDFAEMDLHEGITSIGDSACVGMRIKSLPASLTRIGEEAFRDCHLPETLTIAENLTHIGAGAFQECSAVKTLIFESTPEIGGHAFQSCSDLETVILPEQFSQLSNHLFFECENLKQINLPPTIQAIPDACFFGCTALESIDLPESLHSIGHIAFSGCTALTQIQFPESLLEIGKNAFEDCVQLTKLYIPAAVQNIGELPFRNCTALENICVSEYNPHYCSDAQGALYTADLRRLIQPAPGKEGIFTIPDTVSHLFTWTFRGTQYSEIIVPESVTTIDWQVFADCPKLETVNLPDSVTYLWLTKISSTALR